MEGSNGRNRVISREMGVMGYLKYCRSMKEQYYVLCVFV